MRFIALVAVVLCVASHSVRGDDDKQIKLEDIEHDTLLHETERGVDANGQKELAPQSTQHIQLSYGGNPQDVFVTPTPGHSRYAVKVDSSPADLREQVYHLPKVHEGEQTYSAPAKASLHQPSAIGGGQPIQPTMIPQPQYIYIPSPPQAHHPYVSQAHAYVMVPFVPSPPPSPTPTVYAYSHAPPTNPPPPIQHHQPASYQAVKSIEYSLPSTPITPLQTAVDYKNIATIVPKHTLPSLHSSFRQYYSPGLEYHYTEIVPSTKLNPAPSYSYHHAPTHSYQTSYLSQPYYYPMQQQHQNAHYTNIFKQQSTGLLNSYVPSLVSYRQQQQPQLYKNYHSVPSIPQQQLFTPAHQPQYASYPSHHQDYNTIAYSIPYEHTKRSTKSTAATATLNVKAPKSS